MKATCQKFANELINLHKSYFYSNQEDFANVYNDFKNKYEHINRDDEKKMNLVKDLIIAYANTIKKDMK